MLKKNTKKIFSRIYDQYIEKIYRFVFLKVNSKETAQDITSEVFLKFLKILENNDSSQEYRPLLYKIAKDQIIDYYRQVNRMETISLDSLAKDPPFFAEIEEKIDQQLQLEKIKNALGQLKDPYHDVVVLHYINDLPIPEVAKILERSENSVRVLLCRALEKLREILKENNKKL